MESAFFKPSAIRGRARKLGFQTDASIRFERGVDYEIQKLAVDRASEILFETVGGEFGSIQESKLLKELPKPKRVSIDLNRANKFLGREWTINGIVQKGRQVGKKIGFPTLSLIHI